NRPSKILSSKNRVRSETDTNRTIREPVALSLGCPMGTKQLGVFGLFVALLFGARTAQRTEHPAHTNSSSGQAENRSVKAKSQAPAGKTTAAPGGNDCAGSLASVKFQRTHWWLSKRSAPGCSVSLSPVWKEVCKVNSAHPSDEELLAEDLTETQFL